jgi:hypothetical protein
MRTDGEEGSREVLMLARPEGVYPDKRGQWYFKVAVGRDPLTGKRLISRMVRGSRRLHRERSVGP